MLAMLCGAIMAHYMTDALPETSWHLAVAGILIYTEKQVLSESVKDMKGFHLYGGLVSTNYETSMHIF